MNSVVRRVAHAGVRRAKLPLGTAQTTSRKYATITATPEDSVEDFVGKAHARQVETRIDLTLDQEFDARAKELLPSREAYENTEDPQLGDYPAVSISNQRLPARGWWDQQARRNFGDPVPEYDEVLSMWGPDIAPVTPQTALYHFSLAVLGFVGVGTLIKYALTPEQIAVRREYPYSGLVTELGGLEENKAREAVIEGDE